MGRAHGRRIKKFIQNKCSRKAAFRKIEESMTNKIRELTILCGVSACVIIYKPKEDHRPVEPVIWPEDSGEVARMINDYKQYSTDGRPVKFSDLSNFLMSQTTNINDDVAKLRRKNAKGRYPSWDNRLENYSSDELGIVVSAIDKKLADARTRIDSMKGTKDCSRTQSSAKHCCLGHSSEHLVERSMKYSEALPPPLSVQMPFESDNPFFYWSDPCYPTLPPFNESSIVNPMMMTTTMMNCNGFDQFGDASSSRNFQHDPMNAPLCQDPISGMLENVMIYNPQPLMSYCKPTMQPMPLLMQQQLSLPTILPHQLLPE